jgi:hypothetical protein
MAMQCINAKQGRVSVANVRTKVRPEKPEAGLAQAVFWHGLQESPGQPGCCADQSRRAKRALHLPEASEGRQGFGLQSILLRFPKALPERGRRHHGSLPPLGRQCPHQAGGSSRARRSASDWRARSLAMAWPCVCRGGRARVLGVVAAVVVWRRVWVMCGFAVQTTIVLRTWGTSVVIW